MPAAKKAIKATARIFESVLERTQDNLRWVITRVPFDAAAIWGKRGQLRVQGDINDFNFRSTLFPDGKGGHFMIVNKKMQSGGKTTPGLTAKFRLMPDSTPREAAPPPPEELLKELRQSKRLLKFYESLGKSRRNYIAAWVAEGKQKETRLRRASQIAERLMETLEAERALPPMIEMTFRQNPRARERWEQISPAHRRSHLFSIFHYREPQARARRVAKVIDEMLGRKPERGNEEDFSETV